MSINEFISKAQDFVRSNLFMAFLPGLDKIYCQSTDFPFNTFNTDYQYYDGFNRHAITSKDFDPINLSFILDAPKMNVFKYFMDWKNLIMDEQTGDIGYKNDYERDFTIEVLHPNTNFTEVLASVTVINAFPVNIENLNFDYNTKDTVNTLNVSFRFDKLEYDYK